MEPVVVNGMPQIDRAVDSGSILIKIINMKNLPDQDYCTVESGEACAHLGISRDTLYAYVSRGLVRTVAHPGDARRSLYDRRDVEALLRRKKRGRSRRAVAQSTIHWGEPVLVSKITRIADGRFFYRDQDAVDWSRDHTLEETLTLLAGVKSKSDPLGDMAPSGSRLPFDRILAALAEETVAHRQSDGRPRAGRLMRRVALTAAGVRTDSEDPIHKLLAQAWSDDARAPDLIRRALVLCADHELNASAYAARVAASAGASLPASLLAGLSTLSGAKHGGLTDRCAAWMASMDTRLGNKRAHTLEPDGKPPPLYGHPLYPDGDPRTAELLRHCPLPKPWRPVMKRIEKRIGSHPALDFALAHLQRDLGLPDGAGLGIFAVGRTAGWIAHILEQRETGKLIRPRAAVEG